MEDISKAFEKPKKKCYLSPKMEELINSLIVAEFNAGQLYLSMSTWAEYVGYEGLAKFMKTHVYEERKHMLKLYEYSLDRQCNPVTPAIKSQPTSFNDLKDVLEKGLAHEELIEATYKAAIKVAMAEPDMTTFGLFQWFIGEQIEEIKLFAGLLDRLEIIGNDKKGQFFLDQELSEL